MWHVDGSQGEGGGQLLRISCGLASLLGEPVAVERIRANRSKPGLAAQHLAGLQALAALTGGTLEGGRVGSTGIVLRPGGSPASSLAVDVGTAGSVTLVLQALLPAAWGAKGTVELSLTGGTDVSWSPPWDYFAEVFLPNLARIGVATEATLVRRGHYPAGGGEVRVRLSPGRLRAADLPPPEGARLAGRLHLTQLPRHIGDRMAGAAREGLLGRTVNLELDETPGSPGTGLVLWNRDGTRLGASAMGEVGRPAEDVGRQVAEEMAAELAGGALLDVHGADQVLPWLALAPKPSTFTVREASGHLTSLAALLEELEVARVRISGHGPATVDVEPYGVL